MTNTTYDESTLHYNLHHSYDQSANILLYKLSRFQKYCSIYSHTVICKGAGECTGAQAAAARGAQVFAQPNTRTLCCMCPALRSYTSIYYCCMISLLYVVTLQKKRKTGYYNQISCILWCILSFYMSIYVCMYVYIYIYIYMYVYLFNCM